MANAKDIKLNRLKVLVYGKFRTDKTGFAGSFPKPYFLDFDDGMDRLMGQDIEYDTFMDENPSNPKAYNAGETKLKVIQKDFELVSKAKKVNLANTDPRAESVIKESEARLPKTIVLDSITTLGKAAMNLILLLAGRPGGTPQQNDWLPQMNLIEKTIYMLRALPTNVVVVCHEDMVKDEVIGNLQIAPSITGKLSGRIPNLFSIVLHSETVFLKDQKAKNRLRVQATPTFPAGARLRIINDFIDPTYEAMISAIEEGRK